MPFLINLAKGDSMFCNKDLDNRVFFLSSIEGFSSGSYIFNDPKVWLCMLLLSVWDTHNPYLHKVVIRLCWECGILFLVGSFWFLFFLKSDSRIQTNGKLLKHKFYSVPFLSTKEVFQALRFMKLFGQILDLKS